MYQIKGCAIRNRLRSLHMRVSLCQNWYELELIMCILFIWFFFLRFWQHEIKHSNQISIQFEKKYIYPLITNKPVIYLYYLDDIFVVWIKSRRSANPFSLKKSIPYSQPLRIKCLQPSRNAKHFVKSCSESTELRDLTT